MATGYPPRIRPTLPRPNCNGLAASSARLYVMPFMLAGDAPDPTRPCTQANPLATVGARYWMSPEKGGPTTPLLMAAVSLWKTASVTIRVPAVTGREQVTILWSTPALNGVPIGAMSPAFVVSVSPGAGSPDAP